MDLSQLRGIFSAFWVCMLFTEPSLHLHKTEVDKNLQIVYKSEPESRQGSSWYLEKRLGIRISCWLDSLQKNFLKMDFVSCQITGLYLLIMEVAP